MVYKDYVIGILTVGNDFETLDYPVLRNETYWKGKFGVWESFFTIGLFHYSISMIRNNSAEYFLFNI